MLTKMFINHMLHDRLAIAFFFMAFHISCENGTGVQEFPSDPTPVLKVLSPTNVSETGFQVNWYIENPAGFQSISLQLATEEDMTNSVTYVHIDDATADHLLLENLHGATQYYYKISLLNNGSAVVESAIKGAATSYAQESVDLITEDDLILSGKLAYLESLPGQRPGIIFMHEFGVWVNPWIGSDLLRELVAEGYVCLTFFFRGHGTSAPVEDLMDLVNDKSLVAKDLQAALSYMLAHGRCSGEAGLIGGSLGAIMALAGNGYEKVLTSVALSPAMDGVFVIFPGMTLNSVFYLAGELDIHEEPAVDFPAEARALYELTEEPRKIDIIAGTADHGTSLLERDSLNIAIESWFLGKLPLQ